MAEDGAEIAGLSFEEALAELERIVRQLEDGKGKLDESIEAYTRGVALKRYCESKLAEAEARIDQIMIGADGAVGTKPADIS